MPSLAANARHGPPRSLTWPLPATHKAEMSASHSTLTPAVQPKSTSFEDEINQHPEDHYLSPMYEYEDWANDSDEDDDGEEVEWDAGITDFALFDSDRRAARERHESMPERWDGLIASQASALQRSVERKRADSEPSALPRPVAAPYLEDLPHLTPDNSPQLRDDFDIDAFYHKQAKQQPNALTIKITPPEGEGKEIYCNTTAEDDDDDSDSSDDDSEDEDLPISELVERARLRRQEVLKRERPGLRYTRTLSGKVHVWRRPHRHIYDVREDVAAEAEAEQPKTFEARTS